MDQFFHLQRRDADDISTETAVFRQGRQDVYPLCEFVYNALTSVLPDVLEDVITALTMVPTFLLVFVLGLVSTYVYYMHIYMHILHAFRYICVDNYY